MNRGTGKANRLLLVETGMVLLLILLGILFYMRPAADRMVAGPWWRVPLLVGLFFAVVALHTWRRRRGGLSALRQTIREEGGDLKSGHR